MTVFLLPIEPLAERYSEQWLRWFPEELNRLGVAHVSVVGFTCTDSIEQGQFLDVVGTNYWKATQLNAFVNCLRSGVVKDGDWVLALDGWNPALLQLAYMRDLGSVKFKIASCWHAGSYDPWDMLGQNDRVREWAPYAERAMVHAVDVAFVATEFHAAMLRRLTLVGQKVRVTGFPLRAQDWAHWSTSWSTRKRAVVWPHRLSPEKAPEDFDLIKARYAEIYPDDHVQWLRTKDVCPDKLTYYEVLGKARVAVSTAWQETWGIAMQEAASLGCHPVVPNRLSYPELFPPSHRYDTQDRACVAIHAALNASARYDYVSDADQSIERMLRHMEVL